MGGVAGSWLGPGGIWAGASAGEAVKTKTPEQPSTPTYTYSTPTSYYGGLPQPTNTVPYAPQYPMEDYRWRK